MSNKIIDNIPELGLSLVKYSGKQVIERIGKEVIKEVVVSVLCGENVRSLTENLTRRRLALTNASLLITFIKSGYNSKDVIKDILNTTKAELSTPISKEKKIFLNWFIGLTGKSIQNVLRNSDSEFTNYLNNFEKTIKDVARKCSVDFGNITGNLKLSNNNFNLNWSSLLLLFSAIGTQTLSIRGSEKSMYGKLFEKLILGSLLSILGFDLVDSNDTSKLKNVFWLSSREDKRESDATLLYKPGVGVRFDIGFIGPGNTEISLDKVSRFERELEHGRRNYNMTTIIIIDRIGNGSRISEMAKAINGKIVQMSMSYWVKEICQILKETIGLDHKILKLENSKLHNYINNEIKKIDISKFI